MATRITFDSNKDGLGWIDAAADGEITGYQQSTGGPDWLGWRVMNMGELTGRLVKVKKGHQEKFMLVSVIRVEDKPATT
jgi:hypothetical protein